MNTLHGQHRDTINGTAITGWEKIPDAIPPETAADFLANEGVEDQPPTQAERAHLIASGEPEDEVTTQFHHILPTNPPRTRQPHWALRVVINFLILVLSVLVAFGVGAYIYLRLNPEKRLRAFTTQTAASQPVAVHHQLRTPIITPLSQPTSIDSTKAEAEADHQLDEQTPRERRKSVRAQKNRKHQQLRRELKKQRRRVHSPQT
jgi:hypothetical protein